MIPALRPMTEAERDEAVARAERLRAALAASGYVGHAAAGGAP